MRENTMGLLKHGHSRKGKRSSEYLAWCHMKERCQNPNDKGYHNYGGREIEVCERWQDFENFFEDMGEKPLPELTLERMDNDGNHEPFNCKWATWEKQADNRRPISCGIHKQFWFIGFGPNGEKIPSNNQHEFARRYGLNQSLISECLNGNRKTHGGWTFETA